MNAALLDAELDAVLAEGHIPSLSMCIRVGGREVYHRTGGMARVDKPRRVHDDQAYDLASVTKVLAGTAITASLIEQGRLTIDTHVRDLLPDVDERMTVRHLLEHSSGALWWRAYYEDVTGQWGSARARQTILDAVRAEPLVTAPGEAYRYSDTGYLLLLQVLEAVGSRPLDVLFHEHVRAPSGIDDLRFGWPTAAATERCKIRGTVVEGSVHDQNCSAMGGVSTHAGLFGTARSVAALGDAMLAATQRPDDSPLPGRTLAAFWADRSGPGSHVLGFDTISEGYTSTGSHFPTDTVGHLGFTGCSLWVVPSREAVVVLLSNRVHPNDERTAIRDARPRLHDAVAKALGWC